MKNILNPHSLFKIILAIVCIGIFILILCRVYIYGIHQYLLIDDINNENYGKYISSLGTLGDFIGGVTNPVIGAIGSIAIAITISIQLNQNKKLAQQSYEIGIFNLIGLQNNIIDSLEYRSGKKRIAFSEFLNHNSGEFDTYFSPRGGGEFDKRYSKARIAYEATNHNSNEYFGHYFRNLYTILKTIDELHESKERKKYFARIVRAQLSMSELTVLFLNCLPGVCDDGRFSYLLVKYQMLEHLKITVRSKQLFEKIESDWPLFRIGDHALVTIYEAAFYIFGGNIAKSDPQIYGAFGRNNSKAIPEIIKSVLENKEKFTPIYSPTTKEKT